MLHIRKDFTFTKVLNILYISNNGFYINQLNIEGIYHIGNVNIATMKVFTMDDERPSCIKWTDGHVCHFIPLLEMGDPFDVRPSD